MERRVCRKCGGELPGDSAQKLCETCAEKRKRLVKRLLAGGAAAGAVAAGVCIAARRNGSGDPAVGVENISIIQTAEGMERAATAAESQGKNWLTRVDRRKLDLALAGGLITEEMIRSAKYELEQGRMLVDDFLREWSAGAVLKEFSNWRDRVKGIDGRQFARILRESAEETPNVADIEIFDKTARIAVRSNSGKSRWNSYWDFRDADGELTDQFVCQAPYADAGVLRQFRRNLLKRLKNAVED